jgi:Dehydrogenases (flavoproteins)
MTVRDLGDNNYEVVIVGGGPAGLSAGVRCANEGVKTLLVEATDILLPKDLG